MQAADQAEWQALGDDDVCLHVRRGAHGLSRPEGVRHPRNAFAGSDERHLEALRELDREAVIANPGTRHLLSDRIGGPHDHAEHSRIVPCRMRAVVVIPTLNACGLLAEAVASIEAQTVPVEIIVVDNASSDGTLEMLATRFRG